MNNNLEKMQANLRENNKIENVKVKDDKIVAVTDLDTYMDDNLYNIARDLSNLSETTLGLEIYNGGDELNNKKVLAFYTNCHKPEYVFQFYSIISGLDPVIGMRISTQLDNSMSLESVAKEILDISPNEMEFNNRQDLMKCMNICIDKVDDKQNVQNIESSDFI
jgi:hypothetical protein